MKAVNIIVLLLILYINCGMVDILIAVDVDCRPQALAAIASCDTALAAFSVEGDSQCHQYE